MATADSVVNKALDSALTEIADTTRLVVAFSGGLDSTVLLHALTKRKLRAVHVHHGLQAEADGWAEQCQQLCAAWSVPCTVLSVDARGRPGESPEAAARNARYTALAENLKPSELLITGQHADDQAETVLLQMLRGSGPEGLAAMPALSSFAKGHLLRPLLTVTRADLHGYACQHGLDWIEDPSNQDRCYDRNYLRHEIVPALMDRWPGMVTTLGRVARLQAENARLLTELAGLDLKALAGTADNTLSVSGLLALGPARSANAIRGWLHGQGFVVPHEAHMARIQQDVLLASGDAVPLVQWGNVRVRRYRDDLHVLTDTRAIDPELNQPWLDGDALILADGNGVLEWQVQTGGAQWHRPSDLRVVYRHGGESVRSGNRRHATPVKKLFQELAVPPWERDRLPMVYCGDELVAIADLWINDGFAVASDGSWVQLNWRRC